MGVLSSILPRALIAAARAPEPEPLDSIIDARMLQQAAWENAQAVAKSENRTPDFTDYFIAAAEMAPQAESLGIAWTHKEIADFSNMKINGVTARLEDFDPFSDQADPAVKASVIKRIGDAMARHGQGTEENSEARAKAAQRNLFDLDSNGTIEPEEISTFYADVRKNLNFSGAELTNVTFQPATTLQIVQNAKGAQYANVEFDGLDTVLEMGSGQPLNASNPKGDRFHNVRLHDVKAASMDEQGLVIESGGGLHLNRNTTIDRFQLDGSGATISLAGPGGGMGNRGAQINGFKADGTDDLVLELEPGSRLTQVNFNGNRINPRSVLKGEWHGGEMNNVDMSGVTFGGTITSMVINNPKLENATFQGTRFSNVNFSAVNDFGEFREAMQGASFHAVTVNGHAMNSLADLDKIEQIEKVVQGARVAVSNYDGPKPSLSLEAAAPAKAVETGQGWNEAPMFAGVRLSSNIVGGDTVTDTGNTSQSVNRTADNAAQREANFAEARVAALMDGYVRDRSA